MHKEEQHYLLLKLKRSKLVFKLNLLIFFVLAIFLAISEFPLSASLYGYFFLFRLYQARPHIDTLYLRLSDSNQLFLWQHRSQIESLYFKELRLLFAPIAVQVRFSYSHQLQANHLWIFFDMLSEKDFKALIRHLKSREHHWMD